MELTTVIGVVSGFVLMIAGIMLQGNILDYWDAASLVIVLGGAIAATVASYPGKDLKSILKIMKTAFTKHEYDLNGTISQIIELANIARRDGLLALDNKANEIDDPYMKKGIMLVVDGTDPELIRNIMETELTFIEERHGVGQSMMKSMSAFSPAFGMAGTLIGLISMLKNLNDSSTLGQGMATALITTFYGVIFANLMFTPMASKLERTTEKEIRYNELILEGLLSIQAGENPRLIEEKLVSFIAKNEKEASSDEDSFEGEES